MQTSHPILSVSVASLLYPWSAQAQTMRNIELANHCSKDIWLSFTAGAAPYKSGSSHCSSNTECVDGSECNTVNGICFWTVPVPSNGRFGLSQGEESSIYFPILGNDIVWSGNIVACKDGTCAKTVEDCDSSGCRVNSTSPVSLVSLLSKTVLLYSYNIFIYVYMLGSNAFVLFFCFFYIATFSLG